MEEENFVVKKNAIENCTQLIKWVVATVRSVSARAELTEQAWSYMTCQSHEDCEHEAEQLLGTALLFWKGKRTVPRELASAVADEAEPEIA
eukprot:2343020-Amphidinium_carterae.3